MRTVLYTGIQSRQYTRSPNCFFQCDRCRQIKQVDQDGITTGFATRRDDKLVCFKCCGQTDKLDMLRDGKITLYLSGELSKGFGEVSNWSGTLRFPARVQRFHHPLQRRAWIAYFAGPDGHTWSAKNIGESQIAHCRRLAK